MNKTVNNRLANDHSLEDNMLLQWLNSFFNGINGQHKKISQSEKREINKINIR